jgi:magnesium-transporting ATPase (P-type)
MRAAETGEAGATASGSGGATIAVAHDQPWHALDADAVVALLGTDPHCGLSGKEAAVRLQRFGRNRLPERRKQPAWQRFLRQFHNVLIYVMLAAAVITASLAHWIDTGVLLSAVIVNAIIGFVQEGKAEAALDAIRKMLSPVATVFRDGERIEVAADTLVPGDVVVLAAGDKVPADLRLLSAKNLRVDEAILTGESEVAEKSAAPVAVETTLADRSCMLYSGTIVAYGQATGVVIATGAVTELGRISTLLKEVEEATTPLLRQLAGFSRWLALAIIAMAAATFAIGVLWRGQAMADMFVMVVALAASAIPEGLPAILTITLAIGVQRMAKRNAIIRHLPAVETLGSVTVICSDKTGTLTKNEMTVQRVVTADHVFEISGVGYAPEGAFHLAGATVVAEGHPTLIELTRAGLLCNDAKLRKVEGAWKIEGDPTEGALLVAAVKAGHGMAEEHIRLPRTDVIPFGSEHRLMATLHHDREACGIIYVKGAPERIFEMCDRQLSAGGPVPLQPDYWRRWATDTAARGLRLLALAEKRVELSQRELCFDDLEGGFVLLGLVGIIDPPREEAIAAVAQCHSAGIRVKMITGDHVDTARAIGGRLRIGLEKPALTGAEIEMMDDAQLREVVGEIDVFARASPEHKLRLVQAMQAGGQVVAMTGDGVNDAPALKRADVGVAMGLKGTEAAKEAADVVLADDNFATISNAVREGRGVYDNIRKFVLFMLPTNGGEALVVIAAILFDLILPLTPAQVLWINMVTSSTLGLALAFEPPEADVMRRAPRPPGESLLSGFFVWRVVMVSILMMTGALGLFLWELDHGASVETARTMAVSAVVAAEMFYLFNSRYLLDPVLSPSGLFGNRAVLLAFAASAALQIAFAHVGALQGIFGSTDLSIAEWLRVLLVGVMIFVVAEFEKFVIRRLGLFGPGRARRPGPAAAASVSAPAA